MMMMMPFEEVEGMMLMMPFEEEEGMMLMPFICLFVVIVIGD